MKKQISLMALIAIIATFIAFAGVVSAQANVQVLFFESPYCGVCKQMEPVVASLQAKNPGASIVKYDISTAEGKNAAMANGVPNGAGTPVIMILAGGSQVYYHESTFVDEATLQGIINQYAAKPTPVAQPVQQPKITPSPIKLQATATPMPTSMPTITVEKQPQTVPEFSTVGLGIPALIVGAIYLFVRRN
jgi:thiol-disulfide isomerase/thioredoxin